MLHTNDVEKLKTR